MVLTLFVFLPSRVTISFGFTLPLDFSKISAYRVKLTLIYSFKNILYLSKSYCVKKKLIIIFVFFCKILRKLKKKFCVFFSFLLSVEFFFLLTGHTSAKISDSATEFNIDVSILKTPGGEVLRQ